MDEWARLNHERIKLERELLLAEEACEQFRSTGLPDPSRMCRVAEHIDGCLARLGAVNDSLARMGRLQD
ncbi:hypothetical protein [Azohydromonas lata]|uniref:hypothetical protein n=1 Tax=Azohydromonas lata TaxID=45677 RepID=UPI0008308579|nr:hypothetical protein [Azohydromonas lata]